LDLEYCEVRAPIDGRVSRALLTEGNYVSGVAGGASLLTTLVSVDPVYVYADVDEASLLKFNELVAAGKLGADGKIPVDLQLGDESDFPHHGTIESFDNQVDANTGSILLRSVFKNEDGRILPGLFAHIRLPLSERHPALLVNESSISTDQANKFVMTISTNNMVEYRPIKLGPLIDGLRVVTDGLTSSDRVVVSPVMARVHPGMPVNPVVQTAAITTAKR
jgi:RND family efflux transporter MFP subunit